MNIRALVLAKGGRMAKSRLADVLVPAWRVALQDAMLRDVLSALAASARLSGVAICSPDPSASALASEYGADFILQPPSAPGMNGASAHASGLLARRGADIIAVIPGDLPCLDGADVDAAIAAALASDCCIVIPDRHRQGTNGLLFRAGAAPAFRFGPDSFRRHLDSAWPSPATAMMLRSFADDIDTPDDLYALLACGSASRARHTRAFLASVLVPVPAIEPGKGARTS